jgi:thiamine-monophosphate kinase
LDLSAVPIAADAYRLPASHGSGATPLDHALGDGEDFELILAVPPDEAERLLADQPLAVPLARIGSFTAEAGLWTADPAGERRPLPPSGYQH